MYEVWCSKCQGPHEPHFNGFAHAHKAADSNFYRKRTLARKINREYAISSLEPGMSVWIQDNHHLDFDGNASWRRASISRRSHETLTLIPESNDVGNTVLSGYKVRDLDLCLPANDEIVADLTAL